MMMLESRLALLSNAEEEGNHHLIAGPLTHVTNLHSTHLRNGEGE